MEIKKTERHFLEQNCFKKNKRRSNKECAKPFKLHVVIPFSKIKNYVNYPLYVNDFTYSKFYWCPLSMFGSIELSLEYI